MKNKITYKDAKALLDEGFSVFPVNITWNGKKFDKKPAVAWKEYQNRLPTDEELHKWFDDEKYNGIGLATGHVSGVVVVDVEKGGLKDATELESERISNTISGGKHYFYKAPEKEIGNTVRIGGKQMDFRGDGGFVVVPPSCGIKDGEVCSYTWDKECPEFMLKELPSLISDTEWREIREPLNISEYTNIEAGSRNDNLYRVACSLISKHGVDDAWNLIQDINRTYKPPLSDHEVRLLFKSAHFFIGEKKEEQKAIEQKLDDFLVGEPILWKNLKATGLEEKWIWENYIAQGNITLLTALMKGGKSTLLRCLFDAMNKEEEFAGQPTKNVKVLVISEESSDKWVESREETETGTDENVLVWVRPTRGKPNQKKWEEVVAKIKDVCVEKEIKLVVIDTLSSFWPIDNENDSAQVVRALLPLYHFTENNMGLLLVHHDRKGGGDFGTSSRGSTALTAFVDNIINFTRAPDGIPNQRILKSWGRFPETTNVVIEYSNQGKYITKGEPWIVSKTSRLEKVVDLLRESSTPLTIKELHSLWTSTIGDMNIRTMQRYVGDLVGDDRVVATGERTVVGKIVPVYAPTGWSEGGSRQPSTPTMIPVVSSPPVVATVATSSELASSATTRQPSLLYSEKTVVGDEKENKKENTTGQYKDVIWEDD